jgi:hypothetical protein
MPIFRRSHIIQFRERVQTSPHGCAAKTCCAAQVGDGRRTRRCIKHLQDDQSPRKRSHEIRIARKQLQGHRSIRGWCIHLIRHHHHVIPSLSDRPQNSRPKVKNTFLRPASPIDPPTVRTPSGVAATTPATPSCRRRAECVGDHISPAS